MQLVGFPLNYLKEVLSIINQLIQNGDTILDVKRIRKRSGVKANNRSMINFYWRVLDFLEEKKVIKRKGDSKPKKYSLPKTLINIEEFFDTI